MSLCTVRGRPAPGSVVEIAGQTASASALAIARRTRLPAASNASIRTEQVRLLHGTPFIWMFNLVIGLLASWLLWPVYPPRVIHTWIGLLALIMAARLVMWIRFAGKAPAERDSSRWARIFTLGTFATGCIWGLLAATVYMTSQPAYYVFVVFVLGGMTAGATLRDSAYPPAFYAFAIPAITPTIIALLARDTPLAKEMAFMLMAFSAVLILIGRSNAERIADNIRLRTEQDFLIHDLERMGTDLKQRIGEREDAVAALHESNERFRSIGENAQDGIITVDAQARVIYWNNSAERIFGYSAEEIAGHKVYDLLVPERYRAQVQSAYAEFANTGLGTVVGRTGLFTAVHRDGHEFPLELSTSAMRVGGSWQALGIVRDVTERNAAEAALQQSEAALNEAQRLAHIGSWHWDLKSDTVTWSEGLYRIMAMTPGTPPPRARDMPGLPQSTAGESTTGLQAMMVRCRDTGAPFAADLALPRASGGLVWLSVHGEAVRDAEGAIILVRGTVQDITERKTAEAALRDSEAALQDAQRLAHIGNWLWQPGSDSAIWSEEMFRIFRLNPRKGAPGFNGLEKLLGGDGLTRMREAAATCQADGTPFVLDIEARRADGVPIWISMHGEALRGRDGRVNRMRGTVQDITERKAAEAALKESETTLREAQRLSHIGSWERPIHGSGSHWSHELYRMFGLPPGAEAPSLEMLDRHLAPESGPRLRSALLACLRDGSAFTIDLEAIHSHGDKFWVSVHGEAVRDQSGTITTLRGTVQDITERKSAEQNIAKLHQQMEEQVRTLERHDEQMRTIARMSDLLQACHDRSEAFPIIAATAQVLFRQASGAIALAIEGTHQLETVVQWGAHPHMESQFTLNDCWALRTGRRYEMTAADRGAPCRHFDAAPDGPYVCLPLTVQGETGGLLHLGYPPNNLLDEEKQNLMTSFADVIKLSLANLGLRENLSEQALRDQLTGLFNRHYLAETLPREIRRAERDQVPLSIAVLDLDHFKRLNDTFGHDAGDTVLRAVGNLLRDAMRSADIACRYGGEEFLVVLPDCDAENARALIEKIREQIKTMSLTLRQTPLPAISISAGVAQMSGERSNSEALIAAADRALYAAKRNGRDRVETFTPERRTSPVPEKT